MNSCKCLICRTGNRELADDYLSKFEINIVFKKLNEKIKNLTKPIVLTHCENLSIVPIDNTKQVKIQLHNHQSNLIDEIDFSNYKFDAKDPNSIIEYIQKIQLNLYLLQSEITTRELMEYLSGNSETAPIISLLNQKRCLDMLNESSSLKVMSDHIIATNIVKKFGYADKETGWIDQN